ncbi:MAG: response regulator transcription factor [Reichenbachiella sp.]|uniref:response regulator transcription factor n=1 Tax=Reichenbachiella sp. TaxID=2184521 RepID=UPI002965F0AB|nr:response regulator transcription factor [Reichenbachiella sp.]MDW3208943.1 response regulator transcription factor [Reichenbachiella sp.]
MELVSTKMNMDNPPIKLLLVDDHEIFLEGLMALFEGEPSLDIVGAVTGGKEALQKIKAQMPDILVTDLNMPQMSGIELVKSVKSKYPDLKILVLTTNNERKTVSDIAMSEAEGYILKKSQKTELLTAILRIADGGTYYSNEVMNIILERIVKEKKKLEASATLTGRELEILQLIAEEKSSDQIAEELFISRRTVDTHRTNLLRKTNKETVVGLLKYAYQYGLIAL